MKHELNPLIAARQLGKLTRLRPTLAIVLGSGFHEAAAKMKVEAEISYQKLAGFPRAGVNGHAGKLMLGHLGGTPVLILNGRSHFYEGHSMELVTFPVRVLAGFGIRDLLLTNAAGGINRRFRKGDFMVLADHINFMGVNPLRGPVFPGLPRFVDMTSAYDEGLGGLLRRAGRRCQLRLRSGVYLAVSGPSYETPGGNPRVCAPGRGCGGDEHRPGGPGGAAMRLEGVGDVLYHQSGGRPWRSPFDPLGSA